MYVIELSVWLSGSVLNLVSFKDVTNKICKHYVMTIRQFGVLSQDPGYLLGKL